MAPGVDVLVALALFSLVTSITPGPNNMMLMTSGLNHGARRSLPHLFGIAVGFPAMLAAVGLGLGAAFRLYPLLHEAIRVVGSVYMLFLAWKIANAGNPEAGESLAAPFTFLQAAAFQWVNPKAWVIAVSAIALYTVPDSMAADLTALVLVYAACGGASMAVWLFLGVGLRRFISDARRLRLFNVTMAVLLVLSVLSLWM